MKVHSKFLNKDNYLKCLFFILAILPALCIGFLINVYSVNVPYWDQWAIAPLFEKFHNGSLGFSDLIAQHNESRKFFPRLVFIGLGFLTGWDVRYEMLIIFLLASIVSFNLYRLSNLTIQGSLIKRLSIAIITNLLIFAPIQWENWLWGIQVVVFVPIACITTCLLIAYSQLSSKSKFFLSICLCTISTFSYANGLLSWVVVYPVLFVKCQDIFSNKKWLILGSAFAFITNTVAYFYNYKKPSHHPSFSEGLVHPVHAINYFLSFLGAPLGLGNRETSLIISPLIGLALILILLASCIYLVRFVKELPLLHSIVVWLSIATYSLISAIITTSGRVGFGVEQSLSSRYTTFSVYLTISLIYIVVIIYDDIRNKSFLSNYTKLQYSSMSFLTAIILILHLLTSIQAIITMHDVRKDRLLAKSCLEFINVLPINECLKEKVFPDLNHLIKYANAIDKLGLLTPPLVKNSIIEQTNQDNQVNQKDYGWFDTITKNPDGSYLASGWAVLPDRIEPADCVILTYEIAGGRFRMFSLVTDIKFERADVAKALNQSTYLKSGWRKSFDFVEDTSSSVKLVAWAFDTNTGKYFKLKGNNMLQK
ncbi:MAG: hypothetical protein V7K94_03315 [Nostoc sp.]|uniref:hypothetical protein n=1 Tax=Nostoc sp. TaxID=1180 RepID=UPI002FF7874C